MKDMTATARYDSINRNKRPTSGKRFLRPQIHTPSNLKRTLSTAKLPLQHLGSADRHSLASFRAVCKRIRLARRTVYHSNFHARKHGSSIGEMEYI